MVGDIIQIVVWLILIVVAVWIYGRKGNGIMRSDRGSEKPSE